MRTLIESMGMLVLREDLMVAVWPGGPPSDPLVLDNRVKAVRARIDGLPLCVHTVHGRGLGVGAHRPLSIPGARVPSWPWTASTMCTTTSSPVAPARCLVAWREEVGRESVRVPRRGVLGPARTRVR